MQVWTLSSSKPFLRWVGGKARTVGRLERFVPDIESSATYYEPFLGGGSLFFLLSPETAVLGDSNADLVDCYRRVSDRPDLVWRHLRGLVPRQAREDYAALRNEFNGTKPSMRRAAIFIYLNKTCFNGIWRVNRQGQFNVPYGAKTKPGFPTAKSLRRASGSLRKAKICSGDFADQLHTAIENDFVFLDPPYLPLNDTSFFNHYTADRFGAEQHERVACAARLLASNGVRVMITEGDGPEVRDWYKDFHISEMSVRRFVSSGSEKAIAREVVITSYAPPAI